MASSTCSSVAVELSLKKILSPSSMRSSTVPTLFAVTIEWDRATATTKIVTRLNLLKCAHGSLLGLMVLSGTDPFRPPIPRGNAHGPSGLGESKVGASERDVETEEGNQP